MEEKEALEFLSNQANIANKNKVHEVDGEKFLIGDDVRPYHLDRRAKKEIVSHSLSSIVDYLKSGSDGRKNLLIEIKSPSEVTLEGALNKYGERETLMTAELNYSKFRFDEFDDFELLNIALQSQFEKTEDRDILLKFIGNYKEETSNTSTDDGISQTAVIKTGAASVQNVRVPNPVILKPFRTFIEVVQPESKFVFRTRQGMQAGLFGADGDAWVQRAVSDIKDYFVDNILTQDFYKHSNMKITVIA